MTSPHAIDLAARRADRDAATDRASADYEAANRRARRAYIGRDEQLESDMAAADRARDRATKTPDPSSVPGKSAGGSGQP